MLRVGPSSRLAPFATVSSRVSRLLLSRADTRMFCEPTVEFDPDNGSRTF
jgi:hypothetical protein